MAIGKVESEESSIELLRWCPQIGPSITNSDKSFSDRFLPSLTSLILPSNLLAELETVEERLTN